MPATDLQTSAASAGADSLRTLLRWLPPLVATAAGAAAWLALYVQPTPFAIEIAIAASDAANLQIFYDRGGGVRESDSATIAIRESRAPATYRFAIPEGRYRLLRIDPSDRPGTYTITAIRMLRGSGAIIADVALGQIRAAAQVSLSATDTAAIARVATGSADPQLLYEPQDPIVVAETFRERLARVWPAWRWAAAAFVLAWLLGYVRLGACGRWWAAALESSPQAAIAAAGVAATLVSMYPLLLGRSLVSPNNGGTAMIYDEPPFVFGSSDFDIEDTRGTDVGSIMWGILPYSEIQRESLAAAELPLWNRYDAMGRALWGQGQHYFLEPIHFASLAIPDAALRGDAAFLAARAVFATGAGFATFAATRSAHAAFIVALVAPFVGYFSYRFNHQGYFSIVYAPWLLWSYFRASAATGLALQRASGMVALFSVLQLVGASPKEGATVWVATHATGLTTLVLSGAPGAERLRRMGIVSVAVLCSLLIAAPHWLVFLDTLSRSATMYDDFRVYLLSWWQVPAAVTLGALIPGRPYPGVNGLVGVLALSAFAAPLRMWSSRAVASSAITAALALALACGLVPAAVMIKVPLLRNVHEAWNVFLTAAVTPLLVVAGAGIAALRQRPLAGMIGAIVATLVLWVTIPAAFPPFTESVSVRTLAALGPAFAFAMLYACAVASPTAVGAPLLAALALAAVAFPQGLHLETGSHWLDALLLQPRPRVALDVPPPPIVAARERAGSEPFRVTGIELVLMQGTQTYYRLEGLGGPDVLAMRQEIELFDAGHIARDAWRSIVRRENLGNARGLLDMLGVRFVFSRALFLPPHMPRLELSDRDPVSVVERPTAWPRAYFVDGVQRHSGVKELAAILEASTLPFASIDSGDQRALAAVAALPGAETVRVAARQYHLTPNRTAFVIDAPGPGIAVLGEAFEPRDFVATRNGDTVDYFQINHVFKGVAIPSAGSWTIEFAYRPRLLVVSIVLALIGAVGIAALVGGRRRNT
jgi:hypothetical protein